MGSCLSGSKTLNESLIDEKIEGNDKGVCFKKSRAWCAKQAYKLHEDEQGKDNEYYSYNEFFEPEIEQ